jgi:hypothetical protein
VEEALALGSYGYALFPEHARHGTGIGAAHERRVVYGYGAQIGDAALFPGMLGFPDGGPAYQALIVLADNHALEPFEQNRLDLSAAVPALFILALDLPRGPFSGCPGFHDQLIGDVVLVSVADIRHRLRTDSVADVLDVVEPDVRVQSAEGT